MVGSINLDFVASVSHMPGEGETLMGRCRRHHIRKYLFTASKLYAVIGNSLTMFKAFPMPRKPVCFGVDRVTEKL